MNLQESIRRILKEEKLHATPQELIKNLPNELKELLFKQWDAKQNPEWHPEGNTLKHIIVVIKRAYHHYPDDPNMVMAALFHDLGKIDTYKINPKTNQPTAYGHEDKSTDYVERFKDWIESFEGMDVEEIKYLVKNHMKVKPSTWDQMKDKKKEPITSHPAFDKLMGFTDKLDGGGTDLKESIRRILREETKSSEEKFDKKAKWVKKIIYNLYDNISFIEQSTFNGKPLLIIHFDSDDTSANIESWFDEKISRDIEELTSGTIVVCPDWVFGWDFRKKNADVFINTELMTT